MNRRTFLKKGIASAVGASSLYGVSSQFSLVQAMSQTQPFNDYKALVCVFLLGGNDSLNMLVPTESSAYSAYESTRQNLAVALEETLPITTRSAQYSSLGLHPSLASLSNVYANGHAAFVSNMGPLIQPLTVSQVLAGQAVLPPQLFSHSDQQNHWQTADPQNVALTGWAGRMADLIYDSGHPLSMNLSMAGGNLWQTGRNVLPFALGPNGAEEMVGINTDVSWQQANAAFYDTINGGASNRFQQAFSDIVQRTRRTGSLVNSALATVDELQTEFPASRFGAQMEGVARMIATQQTLDQPRQVFYVAMGGWDTHDNQNADHPRLLTELAEGLAAFYSATQELGVADAVTTFTASDFGRTMTSNGDGTDHGWGGHQIVLGGAVNGGDVYGEVPDLMLNGNQDIGDGRLLPTIAVDQYAATLGAWFGLTDSQLLEVFPNLANFSTRNLSFMR